MNRAMILGRPGSGKSTFACKLSQQTGLPLHHLDKDFFVSGWVEINNQYLMQIQENITKGSTWIIDENSVRSLETRWKNAELMLYLSHNRVVCLHRLIKRLFIKAVHIDDRVDNCPEILRFKLIKYMWTFEVRVKPPIEVLKAKYPSAKFIDINSDKDLENVETTI